MSIELSLFSTGKKPLSPKELELLIIRPQLASSLNYEWHSRLPEIHWSNITRNHHFICYGAMYDWKYFAAAIWTSPVNQSFDMDSVLELRRLAICRDAPKYTATWMIGKMSKDIKKRFPRIERLISYQDTDVHVGTIYKASNWIIGGTTKFRSWGASRNRRIDQSTADKVRWEYLMPNKTTLSSGRGGVE